MENREWKAFRIDEVFEVVDGFYNKKPPMTGGDLPFLGATEKNNGITGYTDKNTVYLWTKTGEKIDSTYKNKLFGPNWIAVTNNGSVGHAYFVPYQYTSSHDVTSLYIRDWKMSSELGLFLVKMLERAGEPFSYARKWRPIRLRNTPIYLPVTNAGTPDWAFMEEYVQIKINKIKATYQLPRQHKITDFRELDEVKWKEYFLTEIFETIKRGKRLKKSDHISGNIPYISSTKMNNGCDAFLGNQKGVGKFRNCLTIANSGSVGSVFYHDYTFIASDHVTALVNPKLTKLQYLFIASRMSKIGEKYSFNREINDARIQREKIQLPVGINGQPDYDYMEQYMKRMENKVIKKIGMS